MSFSAGQVPFGIDKMVVRPLVDDVPGNSIDLPGANTLSLSTEYEREELRGDNKVLFVTAFAKKLTGNFEWAMYFQPALAAVSNGATDTSGTTPNIVITYTDEAATVPKFYQVLGQALAVDGGAFRLTVLKAATVGGPGITMGEGSYSLPSVDYEGFAFPMGVDPDALYTIEAFETETALSFPP